MKLYMNLSMLGEKPTGLGMYAANTVDIVNQFETVVVGGVATVQGAASHLQVPADIAIGAGKLAALKRQLWLRKVRLPSSALAYSPTHHGFPGVQGQVITIHDLICLRFPAQHYLQFILFKFGMPRLLRNCAAVFTVSEATRADVAHHYGYPLERIHVVPNAIDTSALGVGKVNADDPYLLMVGARYQHKNVAEVLAMSELWKGRYKLVITSCSGRYRVAMEHRVREEGLQGHVVFKDYVSRDELIGLYQGCSALVYPSKWEGFGIPPLEALACGRPAIVSDIPAHREVLDTAGIFVSLGDPGSWRTALASIEDDATVERLLVAGCERLKVYTKANATAALRAGLLTVQPQLSRR